MTTRIFTYISPRALGDFIGYSVLASAIKDLFDDGKLYIYYRNDRPYKESVIRCIQNATAIIALAPDQPGVPVDFFDGNAGRPTHNIPFWEQHELHLTDIVLSGNMMHELMLNTIAPNFLRPPADTVVASDLALVSNGLDPAKWFACVYWKEGGYAYRGFSAARTIFDHEPYLAVIRHIIDDLGGQVVRLGHPTPVDLPQMKGFVDLAKVPNSEWLQLYAVSRARFMVASASGPAAYGPAFGVPTANTDQNMCVGVWGAQDYVVTQGIEYNGKLLRQTDAFDEGVLSMEFSGKGVQLHRNTAAELIAATDEMHAITSGCLAWRTFTEQPKPRYYKPNSLTLPIPRRYRRELLIPPSQRTA
jgi:putative glycosyltransferase (TIGR04372 family)